MGKVVGIEETPLSIFVRERLRELGMKQSEFCRLTGFDQGSLSKILSSMITNLSLESVLRLSVGLSVPPRKILDLVGHGELHELILAAYANEPQEAADKLLTELPESVREVGRLALQAHKRGVSLEPALRLLSRMVMRPPGGGAAGRPPEQEGADEG